MNEDPWQQLDLWCEDWRAAERMAVRELRPMLTEAVHAGHLTGWWFVRKGESWRLRLQSGNSAFADHLGARLLEHGVVRRCTRVTYEPEPHAFGGDMAMDVAHKLFHVDSRHILSYLAGNGRDRRRELGLLLAVRMLKAAGQDWYEQGDIWARVAAHRTSPAPVSPRTVAAVQRLLHAVGDTEDSPLCGEPAWPHAFDQAGWALAELCRHGNLTRGLRAVLAHHILFAFNRLGIPAQHQYLLANAATTVVFDQSGGFAHLGGHDRAATVSAVRAQAIDATTPDPNELRGALADHIRGRGTFRTAEVEAAFRTVPRHLFLPGVELRTAYAPKPVVTKRAADGTAISSASSPNLVAEMLEQLQVEPGHRVLEIGAATGINAALLAELVGPTGQVVTIELDEDLATGARAGLAAAGYHQVRVVCGDGALGHRAAAPYDRITVTAGAWDIASAWWEQLKVGGRLVVPLRLHGSGLTRAIAFDLVEPGKMISRSALVCGFVPMRGAAEHAETVVRLAEDVVLHVDTADEPDQAALSVALTHPATSQWTAITIRDDQPVEHLDLWLLTTTMMRFGRLSVGTVSRSSGLVDPALRWAGACVYDGGTLAYLAMREIDDETSELGVIAHGPNATRLTDRLADELTRWDRERPDQPVITARHRSTEHAGSPSSERILRSDTTVAISW